MSQKSWVGDVEELHRKFDDLRGTVAGWSDDLLREFYDFRVRFLAEEMAELREAATYEDVVDALIDLCVVAIGTLDVFGVDARRAWEVVHRANVAKIPGANPSRPNQFGLPDLVKPPGWCPPSHLGNSGVLDRLFPAPG